MRLAARSGPAMAALGALVFPWLAGVVVVVHLATEWHHHEKPVVHDTAGVKLVVHGHRHESGAPRHEHTLVIAKPATLTAKVSLVLVPAAAPPLVSASSIPTTGSLVAPAHLAHSPPRIPKSSLILRI